ncbi:MAG: TPM domain-containing protein [Prevotella sp.]|nr:TPM domain-containing protein [Prevotella sp.]
MGNNGNTSSKGCLMLILVPLLIFAGFYFGQQSGGTASSALPFTALAIIALAAIGLSANKKNAEQLEMIKSRREQLNELTDQYNEKVSKTHNSGEYNVVKNNYQQARQSMLDAWDKTSPITIGRTWKRLAVAGAAATALAGSFGFGSSIGETPTTLADSRSWNAENIPMPHLQDHSLYVSNPDSILSPQVVDEINQTLEQLDDSLGIETAKVIVGHIDNDDPQRMAVDIGNRYGVGRDNRGLVIVVGYLDHSYYMATGDKLEADLTDAECGRLERTYLVPSMRVEQPDSGMLYLARGILALMTEKEMPQMSELTSSTKDDDNNDALPLMLYPLLLAGWGGYCANMGRKVGTNIGMKSLMGDPFFVPSGPSGGGGGSRRSSGHRWSGGGGRSGGYGGGHFSGGGAGGRW